MPQRFDRVAPLGRHQGGGQVVLDAVGLEQLLRRVQHRELLIG
ncbi:MAG: hypothetical protein ACR2FV_17480 [Ornithinimicrobium sp.]